MDGNLANKGVDCDVMWLGGDFIAGPVTDAVDHVDGQTGQVTGDVTLDVLQALANGKTEVNWLVRFANESANGMVKYYFQGRRRSEPKRFPVPPVGPGAIGGQGFFVCCLV